MPDFISYTPKNIQPFELFSLSHILAILCIIMFITISCILLKKTKFAKHRKAYRYTLFIFIIIVEVTYKLWKILIAQMSIVENLSLNICGISIILCAIILINKNEKLYEITYFWGLAGATQAILTPDIMQHGFPHYRFFQIFISHGLIVAVVVYMTVVEGFRPKKGCIKRAFLTTNIYMIFIAIVNFLLGTNYLFICHKPEGASLLDVLGPWPWYIISLEIMTLILFILVYSPIGIINIKNKGKNKKEKNVYSV